MFVFLTNGTQGYIYAIMKTGLRAGRNIASGSHVVYVNVYFQLFLCVFSLAPIPYSQSTLSHAFFENNSAIWGEVCKKLKSIDPDFQFLRSNVVSERLPFPCCCFFFCNNLSSDSQI